MCSTLSLSIPIVLLSVLFNSVPGLSICRNLCGGIAINYPFGVDDGCGSPVYRKMFNCTGDLFFETTSGTYKVEAIDYDKKTVLVYDPGMSTCTMLQPRKDFSMSDIQSVVIPPSPDTVFLLLNCSIDSPVLNHYRSACTNFSGHSCDEVYGACAAFRIFKTFLGASPACCFTDYTTLRFMSMNILDCSHYTTVCGGDDLRGVGPLDWHYGIRLSYTEPISLCERCLHSAGTCGFNTETEEFLCICSATVNTTRDCGAGGNVTGGGNRPTPSILLHVFAMVLRKIFSVI